LVIKINYNTKSSPFIPLRISIFQHNPPSTLIHLSHPGKSGCGRNQATAFITNHKQSTYFLIIMQSATSQMLFQQPKISSSTWAIFISILDVLGSLVRPCLTIFQHSVLFYGMLKSHYSITIHLFQLAVKFEGGWGCGKSCP
jgi:hypothetical protein